MRPKEPRKVVRTLWSIKHSQRIAAFPVAPMRRFTMVQPSVLHPLSVGPTSHHAHHTHHTRGSDVDENRAVFARWATLLPQVSSVL